MNSAILQRLEKIGGQIRVLLQGTGYQCEIVFQALCQVHHSPQKIRSILDIMYNGGVKVLPVVTLVALFAGMILTFQTGIELARFGQEESIGSLTALTMCREMGPFITAVIVAAAVGGSFAAELGTMKVSEEILALEVMSINPIRFLVMPRMIALALMVPILTIAANLVGVIGGSFVSEAQLGVDSALYFYRAYNSLRPEAGFLGLPKDIYTGLIKAFVYGIMISTVSCGAGLRAENGAEGVGSATRRAVRNSIILILVLGYLMSWAFYH